MESSRVYVGRLPRGVRERDLERFFEGYGRTREILLRTGYGFVEFEDYRDADDAVHELNGRKLLGERVIVEPARARGGRRERERRGGRFEKTSSRFGPPLRTKYRLVVENLSSRVNWQDLKDYMRKAGEVTYADAHNQRMNEGVVEFATSSDMKNAIEKLDDTELNGRRIRLVDDRGGRGGGRGRSRSSPSRSRSRSRRRSPVSRSRSRSPRRRSKNRSLSKTKKVSKSPEKSRSPSRTRSKKYRESKSPEKSRSRSVSRSRSIKNRESDVKSKSRSRSPKRERGDSRSPKRGRDASRSRSRSKSESRSRSRSKSKDHKSRSRSRSYSRSRSHSRGSRGRSNSADKDRKSRSASPQKNDHSPDRNGSMDD